MTEIEEFSEVEKAQATLLAEVMAQASPIGTSARVEALAIELLSKRFSQNNEAALFDLAISTAEIMSRL